jgi:methionyl-tRNA formyltransferase
MARLAFLGTPEMAVPPLQALHAAGHEIAVCITRPDRRRGRGGAVSPSPVKSAAVALGLPTAHSLDALAAADVELGVVVAYGRIIPPDILDHLPMVNLHFSLLPRWRGAAPTEWAILTGDAVTGVCVMRVEEGLDTGPVYASRSVPLGVDTDLDALRATLTELGSELLVHTLDGGVAGLPVPQPQHGEPTTAPKLRPDDFRLRWEQDADLVHRVVRLDRAWTTFRGRRLGVRRASVVPAPGPGAPGTLYGTTVLAGAGAMRLEQVQPESRGAMGAEDWIRGIRLSSGERLGSE